MIQNEFYKQIPGYFSFAPAYDRAIQIAEDGDTYVEIGAWLGQSICYLAHGIQEAKKNVRIYTVDTWEGEPGNVEQLAIINRAGGSEKFYKEFLLHLEIGNIRDIVCPIKSTSVEAAKRFTDLSINFCFVDGAHDYNSVMADLYHWFPKIAKGGVIAGHGYHLRDGVQVCQAVHEFLLMTQGIIDKFDVDFRSRVWWVQKSKEFFQ